MILLLDAHALLWWLADDPTMSRSGRAAIEDPANDVIVSAASVWEIEIKRALGELTAPDGLVDAVHAASLGALTTLAVISPLAPVAKLTMNSAARPMAVERTAVMR